MYHVVAEKKTLAPSTSFAKLETTGAVDLNSKSWSTANHKSEMIKSILRRVFEECETPYRGSIPYDDELHNLCLEEIKSKGYPFGSGPREINHRYLTYGVVACCGYPHLSRKLHVYIAIYTALVMWIDDVHSNDLDGVDEFYARFLAGEAQKSEGLQAMASIIKETTSLYGATSVQGSIIVMASLKFISGTLLEYETKTMNAASGSNMFSSYLRSLTGLSEVYAMFTFPPGMNVQSYIQAVPDMCTYIHYYNDLLSFYKEEKRGETNNFVTLEATALKQDKLIVLDRLANEVGRCSRRINQTIRDPAAAAAFESFKQGYLLFHTSLDRYQLGDLFA